MFHCVLHTWGYLPFVDVMYNTVVLLVLVCSPRIANCERYTQFYIQKPRSRPSQALLTEWQFLPGLRFEEAGAASGQAKAGHRSKREVIVASRLLGIQDCIPPSPNLVPSFRPLLPVPYWHPRSHFLQPRLISSLLTKSTPYLSLTGPLHPMSFPVVEDSPQI